MKQIILSGLLACLLCASAAHAAADCYADYKAKQDSPLRLHYGVMQLQGDCSPAAAKVEVRRRLQGAGWILLNVVSVFGPEGLQTREASAGPYFLRF